MPGQIWQFGWASSYACSPGHKPLQHQQVWGPLAAAKEVECRRLKDTQRAVLVQHTHNYLDFLALRQTLSTTPDLVKVRPLTCDEPRVLGHELIAVGHVEGTVFGL